MQEMEELKKRAEGMKVRMESISPVKVQISQTDPILDVHQ